MYATREPTDVVLRVRETFRGVHRVVVATVSPVLRKMFSTGMVESNSKQIERTWCQNLSPLFVAFVSATLSHLLARP